MAISARDFFLIVLAGGGELRHLADVGSLGSLAAGVGVDLGVEHEDVDVLAGSQHVVQAAEADVVGPAVAAEDPDGLLGQVLLVVQDALRGLGSRRLRRRSNLGQGGDQLGVGGLVGWRPCRPRASSQACGGLGGGAGLHQRSCGVGRRACR